MISDAAAEANQANNNSNNSGSSPGNSPSSSKMKMKHRGRQQRRAAAEKEAQAQREAAARQQQPELIQARAAEPGDGERTATRQAPPEGVEEGLATTAELGRGDGELAASIEGFLLGVE